MAMHARKEKSKAQALEPPLTGMAKAFEEARLKPERAKHVHSFGPTRINVPDPKSQKLFNNLKTSVLKEDMLVSRVVERSQIQQAPYASVALGADAEAVDERTRLDEWLAHACPIDYTSFVKTRSPLDPGLDWLQIGDERVCAPQRMKKVKLIAKDSKTGQTYPVYELRREKDMTPDQWVERPSVLIDSWDEVGLRRAKKAAAKRAAASKAAREKLGKSYIEPSKVSNAIVRRPPSVLWFVNHPDGKGEIYNEVYPHGIVDPRAELKNKHQRARGAEVLNNRMVKHREPVQECLEKEILDAYATDLKARESGYTDQQSEVQPVTTRGVDTGMLYRFPAPQPLWTEEENFIGRETPYDGKVQSFKNGGTKSEKSLYPPVSYSDLQLERKTFTQYTGEVLAEKVVSFEEEVSAIAEEARAHREEVLAKEVFSKESANDEVFEGEFSTESIPVLLKQKFERELRDYSAELTTSESGGVVEYPTNTPDLLLISVVGGGYTIPLDHPSSVQILHKLALRAAKQARYFRKKKLIAKMLNGGFSKFLEEDELDAAEYNIEGLIDDGTITKEIHRVPGARSEDLRSEKLLSRPEDCLHNQVEYERYKRDLRAQERAQKNWAKFLKRSKRIEVRRERWSRAQDRVHLRKKEKSIRTYHYDLLYRVREAHKKPFQYPMGQKFLDMAVNKGMLRRLKKITGYDRIRPETGRDYRYMRELMGKSPHVVKGYVIAQTLEIEKELRKSLRVHTEPSVVESTVLEQHGETEMKSVNMIGSQPMIEKPRIITLDDLIVPGTEEYERELKNLRNRTNNTVHIHTIERGDYTTPIGELVRKHQAEFGRLMPRMYFNRIKDGVEQTSTVEETGRVAEEPAQASEVQQRMLTAGAARRAKRRRSHRRALAA